MAHDNKIPVFFTDLRESVQHRIVSSAMTDKFGEDFMSIRSIYIDPDFCGFTEDRLAQRIAACVVIGKEEQKWLMEWDCWDHEFAKVEPKEEVADKKLTLEELEQVSKIISDDYKVYGIEVEAQCLNFDGPLYLSEILEAADYIRSKQATK